MYLLLGTRTLRSGPEDAEYAEDDSSEYHGEVPAARTCYLHAHLLQNFG